MGKFYAVKQGRITGIFDNWPECQKSINGFAHAVYKGFSTKEEAEAFLSDKDLYEDIVKSDIDAGYIVAFCDGSFNEEKQRYSYGVLVIDKNMEEHELCGSERNLKFLSTKNIIGEIRGAIVAMDWAVSNGYSKIKIYHDYEGVAKWISGEWSANSDVAKMYVGLYNTKFSEILEVKFVKVKGHSHNKYNDKADELANKALAGHLRIPIEGKSWFSIAYFEESELSAIFELLAEDFPEVSIAKELFPDKDIYRLKLHKDNVTVTHFKSGKKKLLVQSSNCTLFQVFTTYVYELIGKKADSILSDVFKVKIDLVKIDHKLNEICPDFPNDYPENIKRLMRQSIINLEQTMDCEDYSQFAFPALKALEGHMKYLLGKIGKQITTKTRFSCFDKDKSTNSYILPQ
ncbi:viroplasmin family protein, partial [Synergistaceae bacterium OttesenSCG-928-I11]|nr:viroplasmin family protein [Synergistaceae bacterium OttesenSCG-928-I11]